MHYRALGDSDLRVSEICSAARSRAGRAIRSSSRRSSSARCRTATAAFRERHLDHVDLYQCHAWDDDVPVEESRPEQLRDNAAASGVALDDETVRTIEGTLAPV